MYIVGYIDYILSTSIALHPGAPVPAEVFKYVASSLSIEEPPSFATQSQGGFRV